VFVVEIDKEQPPGVATPEVLKLCGVSPSTLANWIKADLCRPSILGQDGQRAVRYWSVQDVVTVRTIKALRDAGCSLGTVRKVAAALDAGWNATMADSVLLWDGRDVLTMDTAGNVVSVIRRTGQSMIRQTVMQLTTFPLGAWVQEAESRATPVDVEQIREQRRRRRQTYG